MRAGHAVQHLRDGQADGQQHAVEEVEDEHAGEGGQREVQLAAVVDSGPADRCREEPSSAYSASGASITHSPVTGGRPARPA